MTLAIALRCADGLVLATDSRATGGPLGAADISEKFLQVNRDTGIMTYGLAAPGSDTIRQLVDAVRASPGKHATMALIVQRASRIAKGVHKKFVKSASQYANEPVGFIVAGFDGNETGLFKVYHLSSDSQFAETEQDDIIAAQWPLPLALSPYIAFSGMSVVHGTNLAIMLMVLTSTFNPTVGGPIHLATVTHARGFTLFSDHEVQALIESNQPRLAKLKMAWAEGWLSGHRVWESD